MFMDERADLQRSDFMANYFGITGTSSNFFGSFFGTGSTNSSNSSSSILSDYASIKNGSYGKLLKAYYAKAEKEEAEEKVSDTKSSLEMAKSDAMELKESIDALGKASLYNKKEIKAEDGTVTRDYDKDKIYKAAKAFVDNYNSTIETAGDLDNVSILRSTLWMTNATSKNSGLLSQVGITINSDNTLSIDETKFKDSDMKTVQSIFSGEGGFGATINAKASSIALTAAQKVAESKSLYNYNGNYDYSLSTGTMYDSLF